MKWTIERFGLRYKKTTILFKQRTWISESINWAKGRISIINRFALHFPLNIVRTIFLAGRHHSLDLLRLTVINSKESVRLHRGLFCSNSGICFQQNERKHAFSFPFRQDIVSGRTIAWSRIVPNNLNQAVPCQICNTTLSDKERNNGAKVLFIKSLNNRCPLRLLVGTGFCEARVVRNKASLENKSKSSPSSSSSSFLFKTNHWAPVTAFGFDEKALGRVEIHDEIRRKRI